jgi:hypothetical protein
MFRRKAFATLFTAVLLRASGFAGPGTTPSFTTIDNPLDPTFNQPLGIDNLGVITGYFGSGAAGHPNQGYTIASSYAIFLPDNLPGSMQTQATGIANNRSTVGFWSPTNTGSDADFGFIRTGPSSHYTYISINNPLVEGSLAVNQLLGTNGSEIAVGFYNDISNAPHGYAYRVKTNQFIPVNVAGALSDADTGISNVSMICGFFTNAAGQTQGFVQPLSGVSLTTFAVPGSNVTQLLGINNHGDVVGFHVGANTFPHGVIYNIATG